VVLYISRKNIYIIGIEVICVSAKKTLIEKINLLEKEKVSNFVVKKGTVFLNQQESTHSICDNAE